MMYLYKITSVVASYAFSLSWMYTTCFLVSQSDELFKDTEKLYNTSN